MNTFEILATASVIYLIFGVATAILILWMVNSEYVTNFMVEKTEIFDDETLKRYEFLQKKLNDGNKFSNISKIILVFPVILLFNILVGVITFIKKIVLFKK